MSEPKNIITACYPKKSRGDDHISQKMPRELTSVATVSQVKMQPCCHHIHYRISAAIKNNIIPRHQFGFRGKVGKIAQVNRITN